MGEKHHRIYYIVQNMELELDLETHLPQREKTILKQMWRCLSQVGVSSLSWFSPSAGNWQLGRVL